MEFPGVPGNDAVKKQLSLVVAEDRLPHAILFDGPDHSGHHAIVRRLAMAAVCSAPPEQRPCGQCPHCAKAKSGSHPDIFIVEGSSSPRSFHVDVIRQIRADAYIKPNEAARKVYLLFGAQAMSIQAQNALLKVLEEPPAQAIFLLTAPSASLLLPTIRSRTQVFSLERSDLPPDEDTQVAAGQAAELAKAIPAGPESLLLGLTANLIKDRERLRLVLEQLAEILRDACVRRAGGLTLLSSQREAVNSLCQNATRSQLVALFDVVRQAQGHLERNANSTLLVTTLCAKLRQAAGN